MAVTEIWPINVRLDKFIAYVVNTEKTLNVNYEALEKLLEYDTNELKTEKKLYVTGINCEPMNAYKKMTDSYALNDKHMPNIAYHAYQSFKSGEVDAKTAHEIGMKMAEKLWGDKFQVVVATHLNTDHYHNHFAICSTSFIDGSRYHDDKASKFRMRKISDELCLEYGLSVIEKKNYYRNKNYAERMAEKNGMPTILSQMKDDVDNAILSSVSINQFTFNLKKLGYKINIRGRDEEPILSITPIGRSHPWRLSNHFGDMYSYNNICSRIKETKYNKPLYKENNKPVHLRNGAEEFMKVTTLHALYIHTLYQFGLIPKKNNHRKIPVELREDILKLDSIIEETRLLARCHIETVKELSLYKENTNEKIKDLINNRQKYRNRLRRCNEDDKDKIKSKVTDISKELCKLRKEIKYCDNIENRSGILKEKLSLINERDKSERKVGKQNEQFR